MSDRETVRITKPGRILVVDDEDVLRRNIARALAAGGHVVVEAADGAAALAAFDDGAFDAILSDIRMPGMSGIALLQEVRRRDLDVPVVLLTGSPGIDSAMDAVQFGALEYVIKPVALATLRAKMNRAVTLGRIARAKRAASRSMGTGAVGAGDHAGLEVVFDRTLSTVWSAFQPLLAADGTLYGHEALMRSTDPDLPHPGAVLDAAEKLGRLHELGRKMRALAAGPAAANPASGLLFVNLHPHDLVDPELLSPDAPLLAIAHRVVLEITERAPLDEIPNVKLHAAALRERGFRLAIDDLGAGYAGLSTFSHLEPEVVKLDMSIVRDVDRNTTKQKLVGAMTSLCHDLGIVTVAEGIETTGELSTVLALGADVVQGYLLARPGPAFPKTSWPQRELPSERAS